MTRAGLPPIADEIAETARAKLDSLAQPISAHGVDIPLRIEEIGGRAALEAPGIDHSLDMTGFYDGLPIGERDLTVPGPMPDRIALSRRPTLDGRTEGGEALRALVHHVVFHESGHHFAVSDDLHALEAES